MRVSRVRILGVCKMLMGVVMGLGVGLATGADLGEVTTTDLQVAFQRSVLPTHWALQSFRVLVSENTGTKVEPLIKSRFQASITLKAETFEKVGESRSVVFIRPVLKSGEKREVHGIATATFVRGQWKIEFALENEHPDSLGIPRANFTARTILMGSQEETAYRAELQQKTDDDLTRKKGTLATLLAKYGNGGMLKGQVLDVNCTFVSNSTLVLKLTSFNTATKEGKAVLEHYSCGGPRVCKALGHVNIDDASPRSKLTFTITEDKSLCFPYMREVRFYPQDDDTLAGESWGLLGLMQKFILTGK